MFGNLFIETLASDPQIYIMVVFAVVVSIVLHELAHGFMAIHLGDQTPIRSGRITGNPLVHMGPFSIIALLLFGIAWGQMPIDPTRLRGKYAEAKVALAGPLVNLGLAIISLTLLGGLRATHWVPVNAQFSENLRLFLLLGGSLNVLLFVFNLLPIPPLDGSHILANFHQGYALATGDPSKQGIWIIAFIFAFSAIPILVAPLQQAAMAYVELLAGLG